MPGCPAADSLAAAQVPLPSPWQHEATREAVGGGGETGRILPGFGWVTITLQLQTSSDSVVEGLRRPVRQKAVNISMEPGESLAPLPQAEMIVVQPSRIRCVGAPSQFPTVFLVKHMTHISINSQLPA